MIVKMILISLFNKLYKKIFEDCITKMD